MLAPVSVPGLSQLMLVQIPGGGEEASTDVERQPIGVGAVRIRSDLGLSLRIWTGKDGRVG